MKRILLVLALAGCKAKRMDTTEPPPIVEGKCLADIYVGTRAEKQVCHFQGYAWACSTPAGAITTCTRGEAAGERQ